MDSNTSNQQTVVTPEPVVNTNTQNSSSPIMNTTTTQTSSNKTLYIILGAVGVILLCCIACCVIMALLPKTIPAEMKAAMRQGVANQVNEGKGYLAPGQKPYNADTICDFKDEQVFPQQFKDIICEEKLK